MAAVSLASRDAERGVVFGIWLACSRPSVDVNQVQQGNSKRPYCIRGVGVPARWRLYFVHNRHES